MKAAKGRKATAPAERGTPPAQNGRRRKRTAGGWRRSCSAEQAETPERLRFGAYRRSRRRRLRRLRKKTARRGLRALQVGDISGLAAAWETGGAAVREVVREVQDAQALSRGLERDARRYDGGFLLY